MRCEMVKDLVGQRPTRPTMRTRARDIRVAVSKKCEKRTRKHSVAVAVADELRSRLKELASREISDDAQDALDVLLEMHARGEI